MALVLSFSCEVGLVPEVGVLAVLHAFPAGRHEAATGLSGMKHMHAVPSFRGENEVMKYTANHEEARHRHLLRYAGCGQHRTSFRFLER